MADFISRTELLKMLQYNAKWQTDENGEYRRLFAIDINKLIDYIYHMPTSYDVEAVVAELENASYRTESTFDEDGYCNDDSEDVVELNTAISIVRGKE